MHKIKKPLNLRLCRIHFKSKVNSKIIRQDIPQCQHPVNPVKIPCFLKCIRIEPSICVNLIDLCFMNGKFLPTSFLTLPCRTSRTLQAADHEGVDREQVV